MRPLWLLLLFVASALGAPPPTDPATEYRLWIERFAPDSVKSRFGDEEMVVKLVIKAVEGDEKKVSKRAPIGASGAYSYGCEVSTDGRVGCFSRSSGGTKEGGYPRIPDADRQRLDELLARLPGDGSRLPPAGRRVLVQVMESGRIISQVYDRANAPDEVLELLRVSRSQVRTWLPEFQPVTEFPAHEFSYDGAFCLTPDRRLILTSDMHGPIKFWNPETMKLVKEIPAPATPVAALTFSPDGALAVVTSWGELHLSDTATWKSRLELSEPFVGGKPARLSSPAFTADGRFLLLQSGTPALCILDTTTWEWQETLPGIPRDALAYLAAPGGRLAIVQSANGAIILWDVDAQREHARLDSGARIHRVAYSPDGSRLAMATVHPGRDNYWTVFRIRIWDLATGGLLRELRPFEQITCEAVEALLWTPDGQYVIGATTPHPFFSSRSLSVWNARSGRHRGDFAGCPTNVFGAALLPDGRLAAGCQDGLVRVWNFEEGLKGIREFEASLGEQLPPRLAIEPPSPAPALARAAMPARLKPFQIGNVPMRVEFGSFAKAEHGAEFTPATSFPLRPGVHYGWRLHVADGRDIVPIKEELRLPAPPKVWSSVNSFQRPDDGLTAITESPATVFDGTVEQAWTVAPGDPPGRYILRLSVDGELIGKFEFDIVEDAK